MIDKIKKIQDSVEDIRKVLIDQGFPEAECADISDLDDLIQRASQNSLYNNSRIVWSVGSEPQKPTATLLDTDTGLVKDLDSEWDYIPTSKTRAIQTDVWMSVAIFDESGYINGEWSEPAKLTGEKGSDGENGKDGIDGAPGKDGTDGKDGKDGKDGAPGRDGKDGSMFEFIYLALPSQLEIEAPKSVNEDKHLPWFDQDTQWTDNPVGVSPSLTIEYVSQREKNRDTGVWGPWSKPAIWAQWGKNGRDGNGVEYIFCLTNDIKDVPTVPESNPDQSESAIDGWTVVVDGYTWHDNPQDTSETMRYCWVSIRKQHHQKINDVEVQKWGPYSTPVIWSRFAEDGKWGGRTVQVFSSADIYNLDMPAPVGGSWNPADNSIVPPALPDSFKPDNILYDKTFFTNADEVTYKFLYTSYANFDGDGHMTSEWSKPVCITGENGQPGTDGESIQFIFRRLANKKQFDLLLDWHTNSGLKLENVESPSKIDFSNEYIDGWISTDDGYTVETTDWTDEAEGLDANLYHVEVYCYRTKNPELGVWSEWSMPMYWSIWGEDGQDGAGVEYIYKVTADISKEGWDVGKWDSAQEAGSGHELWLPSRENLKLTPITIDGVESNFDEVYYQNYQFYFGNSDNWPSSLDFDWTDEPQDVGPDQPVEWVRQRKYTYNPETEKMEWGDFSEPVIWDKWVTDGGAYKTSYVFTRSSTPITDLPQGGGYLNPIPTNIRTFEDGSELPMWYDSVPGTDEKFAENEPIYISKRTFYSKDWTEKDGKEVLVDDIVNGNRKEFDPDWSTPAILSDTNTFQIEWSTDIDCPAIKPLQPYWEEYIKQNSEEKDYTNFEEGWREENPGWSDVGTNAIWMATATFRNGQWSDWSVTKVKGEQGDAGADGVSVNIKGAALYINIPNGETIPTSPNVEENGEQRVYHYLMVKTESGLHQLWTWNDGTYSPVDIETIQNGDGYLTRDEDPMIDGYLWTWDGDSWEKIGHIQGPAGETYHLYIRFSDDGGHTFTSADSETPNLPGTTVGKYIGYCVSEYEVDSAFVSTVSNYTWAPWLGEDGWGKEQIFIATNIDIAPPIPKRVPEDNVVDYCPLIPTSAEYSGECSGNEGKWTDRPISPTETFPYVWSVERKASASEFGDWKGDILNPGKAILYNKYVWDTNYVELINDLAVIPMEGSQIDPDFADPIENKILLYEGSNLVEDDENDPNRKITYKVKIGGQEYESTNDDISIDQETGLVKIINLTLLENVDEVTYVAVYRGKAYSKRMKLLKTQHAYEILLNQHVIRRTPYDAAEIKVVDGEEINTSAYPIDKIVSGTIRKWNGTEWFYPDDLEINASYTHINDFDGDDSITSNAETATVDNGHFEFDIADEQGLEKIKIWFENQDGEEIWEEIGVVANGKDGAKGEDVVTVRLKNPSAYRIRNNGKIENLTISTGIEAKVGAAIKEFTAAVTELPDGFTILNRNPETGEIYYDPSSIIITIPEDIEVGVYNIVFQIVIDDELYTEIFTLTVVQNGENAQYYEIYPNTNIVKNPNSGNPEPSTVYPIIWSINGNSSEQIDGIPAGYSITYTIDDKEINYNKPIPTENVTSQLIFTLYDKDRKEIDYCEVDPLWDGTDGVDGTGITTRIANPNVKIQVNNKGEFTGFGQTNYLQVFNGTKDITSDCIFVAETNPFFNSIDKKTRVVNGEDVVVGEFVIDEPTGSFEHTPGIYLVDIWIREEGWTSSMVETLTVSIESQGGESPIILDLTNSRVNIKSAENIVPDTALTDFRIETNIYAWHGNNGASFEISEVSLIYQNSTSTIDAEYYSFTGNTFVLESGPLKKWAKDKESTDCDIKISGNVTGADGDKYSKSCIVSIHKTDVPLELKVDKHVINSDDSGLLTVNVFWNGEQIDDEMFNDLALSVQGANPQPYKSDGKRIGWTINIPDITAKETVLLKLNYEGNLIDWEDIPIVQNGINGDNACYYTIDSNYSWIVKDSEGTVKVPQEDPIEPIITKVDGSIKTKIDNWENENVYVKYIIDGEAEAVYEDAIDPNDVTNQIRFFLYVNDSYYDEFAEVNVVYQEKGEKGDSSDGFDSKISPASTVLFTSSDGTLDVHDPVIHSTLSVSKNTNLLTVTNITVAESGNYLSSPTNWFTWETAGDKLYKLSYEINNDVLTIEESDWNVTLYVTAQDSDENEYNLYVDQPLAIKKSGGENAFGVDLLNNHTWLVINNGEISNDSVNTSFKIFDGPKQLHCVNAKLTYNNDKINSSWDEISDGDSFYNTITITNKADLNNLGSDIDLILTVTAEDNRSASTIWSFHKSSTQQPYLILSPNAINSSTTVREIEIKVFNSNAKEVEYSNGWEGFDINVVSSLSSAEYLLNGKKITVVSNVSGRIGVQLLKNNILLDEEWVPVVKDGNPGDKGEDAIVSQLTNPSSTILIVDGEFQTRTATSGLQIRKNEEFYLITSVEHTNVRIDGNQVDKSLINVNCTKDDSSPYKDTNLTFTLNTGIVVQSQVIEVDLDITCGGYSFKETKTIIIQEAGENGENAQYYQIDANHRWIVKKSDGTVTAPTEAIKPTFWKIDGSDRTELSFTKLTEDGYSVYKSINGTFNGTKLSEANLSTTPELVSNQLVYYLCKDSETPTSAKFNWTDYVEIDVTAAEKTPLIYPAGIYSDDVEYYWDENMVPYVFLDNSNNIYKDADSGDSLETGYYVGNYTKLSERKSTGEMGEYTEDDYPIWISINSFEAIYSDIGVFKEALVGKWVFYKEYMFSQYGWDPRAKKEISYNEALLQGKLDKLINENEWIPNILFNAKTGEGHFGAGKVKLGNNTNVTSVGGWEVTDDGLVAKNSNTELAKLGNDGSGYLGSYTDDDKSYKGIQWDNTSLKLGNNLKITNDGFIVSDNLSNPTSYFKLSEWEALNGDKSQYLSFKASNKSGFRTNSDSMFGLAVYGTGAYEDHIDNTSHNGALSVIQGNSAYGLFVNGKSYIQGDLDVTGQLTTSDGTYTSSDERLKNFYDEIEVDLDSMSQINKKYFSYKDSNKIQIGVSAQEVQKLYPELVGENDGYLTVAYDKLSVIALKAIDVLHQDNLKLKAEIEELKKLIAR